MITGRFWAAFAGAMIGTAAVLALIGWAVATLLAPRPPERFVSGAFEFQLPKGWSCRRTSDGTTTCMVHDAGPQTALCILALKYRGPQDTRTEYAKHLARPREFVDPAGTPIRSEVRGVEIRTIGPHQWVSAIHYQSEVPKYFTQYLATVTSRLGILVTFSAREDVFEEHRKDFEAMIASLAVYERG